MKKIIIDSTSNEEIKVGLEIEGKVRWVNSRVKSRSSQVILPLIDKILKKHKLSLKDLTSIEVNSGPGSFTGTRVGVSIANALSFALKIPVNSKKQGEFVDPQY